MLLLHGFPYDIHGYVDVIPLSIAAVRLAVIVEVFGRLPTSRSWRSRRRCGRSSCLGVAVVLAALGVFNGVTLLDVRRALGSSWAALA